ncbi:MAG: LptF/LptG family permease [Candidatus Omnitrophica bacterium]|nr:LptF/LptG family permease [Candidatus Omnitrophota bacterium]
MRIIEKYILKNFLLPLIYISASFVLLFVIIDIFGHLDEFIRAKVELRFILNYYFNYLPIIFVQVLPFSGLLASIYSLGNLQRYNEITAMHSCGIGLFKIIRPYFVIGLMLSILTYILNEKVNPHAFRITYNLKENFEKNKLQRGYIENVTLYGKDNRIIYARRYDMEKKILYDLVILEHDRKQILTTKITARLAIWEEKTWKLYGIVIYRLDPEGHFLGEPDFREDREMQLTESPQDIIRNDIIAEAMSSDQLRDYVERFKGSSDKIVRRFLVELEQKRVFPFYVFILILLGIPYGLVRQSIGKFMCVGIAFATGILFYGMNAVSLGLAKAGMLPPCISAWLVPFVFIVFSIILIKKSPH